MVTTSLIPTANDYNHKGFHNPTYRGIWARLSDVWKIEQSAPSALAPQSTDTRFLAYLPAIKRTADSNGAEHCRDLEGSIHGIFNWGFGEERNAARFSCIVKDASPLLN